MNPKDLTRQQLLQHYYEQDTLIQNLSAQLQQAQQNKSILIAELQSRDEVKEKKK